MAPTIDEFKMTDPQIAYHLMQLIERVRHLRSRHQLVSETSAMTGAGLQYCITLTACVLISTYASYAPPEVDYNSNVPAAEPSIIDANAAGRVEPHRASATRMPASSTLIRPYG